MLPTVAPGKKPGALRIASSVLHILSQTTIRVSTSGAQAALVIGQKAAQERFSEESFRNSKARYFSENVFLKSSTRSSRTTLRDSRHTPSLD
jgi:hypothetical protein